MSLDQPPVRVCCGQRHLGPQCPDGLVMCQLCFNRVSVDRLLVEDGATWDVCAECPEDDPAEIEAVLRQCESDG